MENIEDDITLVITKAELNEILSNMVALDAEGIDRRLYHPLLHKIVEQARNQGFKEETDVTMMLNHEEN